jgi:hypothetical protein
LVWVAAVLVLSAIIPQIPPRIEDPTVRSQWLANVPTTVRPAVGRLQILGLFNLLDSIWLRLPLGLLLAHALVMLAAWLPAIWSRVRRSPGEVSSLGKSFGFERELPEPAQQAGQPLIQRLEKAGYRTFLMPDQVSFIAWRWRLSWLGLAGIYLGLALVSGGVILQGWLGQAQGVSLEPDNPLPLPLAAAPNLALEGVAVSRDDPLRPADGVAMLRIGAGVGEGRSLTLRLHGSRLWQGLWLTFVDVRPMAEVTAVDAETAAQVLLQPFSPRVAAQERVRLSLIGDPEARFVGVPSENVTLHVDYRADAEHPGSAPAAQAEDAYPKGAFSLSFFRGAEATPTSLVSLGSREEVTFDGVRYRITFDYDAGLHLNSALWWLAVAVGWGATALSFLVLTLAPPVYARGSLLAAAQGCRVTLAVDVLGDEPRRHRELGALVRHDD